MFLASQVAEEVGKVAPIDSVSIGNRTDKTTWVVRFKTAATDSQKTAAQAIIDGFDLSPERTKKEVRKAAIANMDAEVVKLLRAMYTLVAKNGKPFDDWRDDVLGVADLQSSTKK